MKSVGVLLILCFTQGNGQFANFFQNLMNGGGGGSNCITSSISCMPVPGCRRVVDHTGCPKCDCSSGSTSGSSYSQGNSRNSGSHHSVGNGLSSGGGGFFNPMMLGGRGQQGFPGFSHFPQGMSSFPSSMLGGGINPMNPLMGSMQTNNKPAAGADKCGTAPYTCMAPPPWCQRLIDEHGCVTCKCGSELQQYLQFLSGITTAKPSSTASTATRFHTSPTTTVNRLSSTTVPSLPSTPPPPTTTPASCLLNFYCTKICDNGYKTDSQNCPVCECLDGLVDTPVHATDPPGKGSKQAPVGVTNCPGIFDCAIMCNNGYQTDAGGCPLCKCI